MKKTKNMKASKKIKPEFRIRLYGLYISHGINKKFTFESECYRIIDGAKTNIYLRSFLND